MSEQMVEKLELSIHCKNYEIVQEIKKDNQRRA